MAWYPREKRPEETGIWAPEGATYLINIDHPLMLREYQEEKRALGIPVMYPMGDAQRRMWEVDIIRRYGHLEKMPGYIRYKLLTPLYRPYLDKQFEKKYIKKDRQGGRTWRS